MSEETSSGDAKVMGDGLTVEECEGMIRRSLRRPMVKFLREHIVKNGCSLGDNFIKAVHCKEQISGGYIAGEGIRVCCNHMKIQDDVNQVVIHELIHAYDECRAANLDWANCAHHACSEIRAGHLSGDCHYKRELLQGFMKILNHEPECIRRRVMMSVTANPNCSESAAKDAMEAVWDVPNSEDFKGPFSPKVSGIGRITVPECQGMITKSLERPKAKFLVEQLEKAGCRIGDNFIKAVNCRQEISGGYVAGQGIVVCSNHMKREDDVNQVVIHELIHAYDECRAANLKWHNCAHQACSEIRANHLSGDCHYKRELLRGNLKIRGHEPECVRRRAMLSVLSNPGCPNREIAKNAIEAVWDVCYNDTEPFEKAL